MSLVVTSLHFIHLLYRGRAGVGAGDVDVGVGVGAGAANRFCDQEVPVHLKR